MIISRESDYAIRLLRKLADGEQHSVIELCESEQIPRPFGYKILEKLQRYGVVYSKRGKGGGCKLIMDLHDVSVYDLLDAIDHECYLNACLTPGHQCPWQECHEEACKVHRKLQGLQAELDERLKQISLYHLILE